MNEHMFFHFVTVIRRVAALHIFAFKSPFFCVHVDHMDISAGFRFGGVTTKLTLERLFFTLFPFFMHGAAVT